MRFLRMWGGSREWGVGNRDSSRFPIPDSPFPSPVMFGAMNLLIFDVDGTLTRTTGVDDEAFVAAVRGVMGFTIVDTDWGNYVHSTDHGLAVETSERYLGRAPTADEIGAIKGRFIRGLRERIGEEAGRCRAVAGAKEMLGAVRAQKEWRVGIASGAWAESAGLKLAAAGVDVSGLAATYSRTGQDGGAWLREAIIGETMRALTGGLRPERVVYVGDGVWDARAAKALGIGFVGVRVDGREEGLRTEGVTRVVRDYTNLGAFLGLIREAGQGL